MCSAKRKKAMTCPLCGESLLDAKHVGEEEKGRESYRRRCPQCNEILIPEVNSYTLTEFVSVGIWIVMCIVVVLGFHLESGSLESTPIMIFLLVINTFIISELRLKVLIFEKDCKCK